MISPVTFHYSITRPYPYRWFAWVVLIGGTLLAVLISVFSLASNGYYLDLTYTRNLNETLAEQLWFDRPPFSWVEHITSKCQAMELQVGTRIFTDKRIREYTISSLRNTDTEVLGLQTPVIMYSNNVLENCTVNFIVMHLYDHMSVEQYYDHGPQIPISLEVKAYLSCGISTPNPTTMTMTVDLLSAMKTFKADEGSPIPSENTTVNQSENASGVEAHQAVATFILSVYMIIMASRQNREQPEMTPGIYTFTRNPLSSDVDSPDFFLGDRFTAAEGDRPDFFLGYNYTSDDSTGRFKDIERLNVNFTLPTYLDRLTKVFYSSILADVGQPGSNLINDQDHLLSWANESMYELAEVNQPAFAAFLGLVQPWVNRTTLTSVETEPSTIYTQYQCQVPRMKPMGTLIMSVFLADLVFLQALWKLLQWVTVYHLQRKDPDAMNCARCAVRYHGGKDEDGESLYRTCHCP
ncbi:hypothetical protein GQ53DRAFT_840656 [Thozetella sp. PMI_491]|nr:hypothetical protein GQ53DRAFT_840656 [Thozetella sp. PMI_491]